MTRPARHSTEPHYSGAFVWIGRQLLLVPEAVLLVALLCLHVTLGAPVITALIGLGIVGWFGCRSALLWAARRTIDEAHYDRATRYIRLALLLYPFSADAYALRGSLHSARGETAQAEQALRRAIEYYPGQAMLHASLSGALLENGQPRAAHQEALRALALDAACTPAYLHLANADQMLGASFEVVEGHVRAGLRHPALPADEAALRCTLTSLLIAQERLSEAQLILKGIEVLLESCPTPQRAGLYYYLGELRRTLGDLETARSNFSSSERIDPHGRYAAAAWRAARS